MNLKQIRYHSTETFSSNYHIQRLNLRFFTISSLHREPSPTSTRKWPGCNLVQITCNTLSAYHVQHVMLCATWYEGTAQLLSLNAELKSHVFELFFFNWPNHSLADQHKDKTDGFHVVQQYKWNNCNGACASGFQSRHLKLLLQQL